ncbi:MAG: ribonuclease P protein component [Coriobacteriales bacterium]|jgi:ribonuclease P protein component|nr:ribonuclease P protein component [Coriobacteriales bacterium]
MRKTLKSKQRINEVFNAGKKISSPGVVLFWSPADQYCHAVLAGKRLGSAPKRSRAKRRLRAALADLQTLPKAEVVLLATKHTVGRPFGELQRDLGSAFDKLANKLKYS